MIIKDKGSFQAISEMIQSEGWQLFSDHMKEMAAGHLSAAIKLERSGSDRDVANELGKYSMINRIMNTAYEEYRQNYDTYKGSIS